MSRPFLILSSRLSIDDIMRPPYNLAAEDVYLTGYDSLAYIPFQEFPCLVMHDPPLDDLTKAAQGIADTPRLEALARIFSTTPRRTILILSESPSALAQPLRDLDVEPIRPADLAPRRNDLNETNRTTPAGSSGGTVMTADDIRDLHQKGVTTIDPAWRLTSWAQEVADALDMATNPSAQEFLLLCVPARTMSHLRTLREQIHAAAVARPDLLFLLPPPLLPCFAEVFPSLRRRMVSSHCTWADEGAFTGETSMAMIQDQGCHGAMISPDPVYHVSQRLPTLIAAAHKRGLTLFLQNPLARGSGCDIMTAPTPGSNHGWAIPPGHTPPGPGQSGKDLPKAVFITDIHHLERTKP